MKPWRFALTPGKPAERLETALHGEIWGLCVPQETDVEKTALPETLRLCQITRPRQLQDVRINGASPVACGNI